MQPFGASVGLQTHCVLRGGIKSYCRLQAGDAGTNSPAHRPPAAARQFYIIVTHDSGTTTCPFPLIAVAAPTMKAAVLASGAAPCRVVSTRAVRRSSARPFVSSRRAPVVQRNVTANFFKFGKKDAEDAGIVGSQGRSDYIYDDVEQYFNYMGFLATEGTYDRMEAMLSSGLHPIDVILLLACSENDTPKVQEILRAGADPTVKGLDGKTPMELADKPELVKLLKDALASKTGVSV